MEIDYLDQIYKSLTPEQKEVLDSQIKRSRKTVWLNELAKMKGILLDLDDYDNNELVKELEWELIDYEDAGFISKDLRCVCGKALRYRYVVGNSKKGLKYGLGREHLQQYTGIDSKTVHAVVKGISKIDLERDEILRKVGHNWKMEFEIQDANIIPKDMALQIKVGLPLLDRQINRLKKILHEERDNSLRNSLSSVFPKKNYYQTKNVYTDSYKEQYIFNCDEFKKLYSNFTNTTMQDEDLRRLHYYLKNNKSEIEKNGYVYDDLIKENLRILGRYGSSRINARSIVINIFKLKTI